MEELLISYGKNDILFMKDGRKYIDLLAGFGTALLGHSHPTIIAEVEEQLNKIWITGHTPTPIVSQAKTLIESFFPPSYQLASLYSTGMEATEFALRIARVTTGRSGIVGFARSMHGKSMATAYLGWHNDLVTLPEFHRLPFLPECSEAEILQALVKVLASHTIAAVFLEPLQGSGGGYVASIDFYQKVSQLCHQYGSLCIVDEVLTGFYRTGSVFFHQQLELTPDIVVVGKTMGNGFPVSGVVVDRKYPITKSMLPGSTYAGNPLAAAAITATLKQMQQLDLPDLVMQIENIITDSLCDLKNIGIRMRGKGAVWILELPSHFDVAAVVNSILQNGVLLAAVGPYIRLLPAATIDPDHLIQACSIIRTACLEAHSA